MHEKIKDNLFTPYLRRLRLNSIEASYDYIAEEAEKKVKEQPTLIDDCDVQLIKRLIKKISVFQEKFSVEFKSGVKVDVVMYV